MIFQFDFGTAEDGPFKIRDRKACVRVTKTVCLVANKGSKQLRSASSFFRPNRLRNVRFSICRARRWECAQTRICVLSRKAVVSRQSSSQSDCEFAFSAESQLQAKFSWLLEHFSNFQNQGLVWIHFFFSGMAFASSAALACIWHLSTELKGSLTVTNVHLLLS